MENNNLHILVVDDDDRIRSLLKDYLSTNSYFVSTAENADEAKTKIKYFKFEPYPEIKTQVLFFTILLN